MLVADGVVFFLLFALWVWAFFDCISTDASLCRNLPKGMWLIIVIFLPDIGSLAWLFLGRPERAGWRPGSTDYSSTRRPVGVEDHPRYSETIEITDRRSKELDDKLDEWQAEQARKELEAAPAGPSIDQREADLARREAELKARELEMRERELERRERELDEG